MTSIADPAMARPAPSDTVASTSTVRVRDPRLDFFRGIAMFIILIAHVPGNWLTLWIPARFGFSDATEIFVFCSGMASAIAFGKVFSERGWALGAARVAFRVWQVYWAHIGLFLAVAATMAALNGAGLFERDYVGQLNLYPFFNNPADNLVGLVTLTYVPNYFDILPMYMVILAMMPVVVALHRIHATAAAVFVFSVWLLAQEHLLKASGIGVNLHLPAEPWSKREWFFNPFGWQLIFFTGFAFMRRWIPAPPVRIWLIGLAIAIVVFNAVLSHVAMREFGFDWARDWRIANRAWITKTDFGVLRYAHFLSLAYLAWILVGPGGQRILPPEGNGVVARGWTFLLAVIMKVGQQSLAVFIASMYLARLMGVCLDVIGRNHLSMLLINLAGFTILIGAAYGAGWFKSHPWRKTRA